VTAHLVAHLVEIDARKIHEAEASGSLHAYCVEVLRLSDSEAYLRIRAAVLARHFPLVLDMICDGSTNVSCLKLLSPHLTIENHAALLAEASGKRKSEVETMVARLAPRPDVPTSMRRLPPPRSVVVPAGAPVLISSRSTRRRGGCCSSPATWPATRCAATTSRS
jgi:hypothetical protein